MKSPEVLQGMALADKMATAALRLPLTRRMGELARQGSGKLDGWQPGKGRRLGDNDMFLIEAWNSDNAAQPFTLSFLTAGGRLRKRSDIRCPSRPGYSRAGVPAGTSPNISTSPNGSAFKSSQCPKACHRWFSASSISSGWPSKPPKRCARAALRGRRSNASSGISTTHCGGGPGRRRRRRVTPIPAAIAAIVELDRRGILNSIASKNDPELATKALERFGLIDYFVAPEIGWRPKSGAIREIAAALNIGMDTLAFIDDQSFERGEVEALCPGVEAYPQAATAELATLERFVAAVTSEGSNRRSMYQTEARREVERARSPLDYDAFLRSCDIKLEVQPAGTGSRSGAFLSSVKEPIS